MHSFSVETLSDYNEIFSFLDKAIIDKNIVLLTGDLGVGKTTFVKEFLKFKYSLSDQSLTKQGYASPTFTIQNQYEIENDLIIHFDFYRVRINEYDIEDDIDSIAASKVTFMEWPEKINAREILVDYNFIEIEFSLEANKRQVTLKG